MRLLELLNTIDTENKAQERKYKRNIIKHTDDEDTKARLKKEIVQSQADEAKDKANKYLRRLADLQTPQNA